MQRNTHREEEREMKGDERGMRRSLESASRDPRLSSSQSCENMGQGAV